MKKTLSLFFLGIIGLSLLSQCGGNQSENTQKTDSTAQNDNATKPNDAENDASSSSDEDITNNTNENVIKDFAGTFSYPLGNVVIMPIDAKSFDFELSSDMEDDCIWQKKGQATLKEIRDGVHIFNFEPQKGDESCVIAFRFDPENTSQIFVIREGECEDLQERCLSSQGDDWIRQ